MKTYIHDGKEVVLTGRKAIRPPARRGQLEQTIYEIKPLGVSSEDRNFCVWVKKEELYIVQADEDE